MLVVIHREWMSYPHFAPSDGPAADLRPRCRARTFAWPVAIEGDIAETLWILLSAGCERRRMTEAYQSVPAVRQSLIGYGALMRH